MRKLLLGALVAVAVGSLGCPGDNVPDSGRTGGGSGGGGGGRTGGGGGSSTGGGGGSSTGGGGGSTGGGGGGSSTGGGGGSTGGGGGSTGGGGGSTGGGGGGTVDAGTEITVFARDLILTMTADTAPPTTTEDKNLIDVNPITFDAGFFP